MGVSLAEPGEFLLQNRRIWRYKKIKSAISRHKKQKICVAKLETMRRDIVNSASDVEKTQKPKTHGPIYNNID